MQIPHDMQPVITKLLFTFLRRETLDKGTTEQTRGRSVR